MKVRCIQCQEIIYECSAVGNEWAGTAVNAGDFTPIAEGDPHPTEDEEPLCPRCGLPFCTEDFRLLLENWAWWPSPPPPTISR